VRRRAGITLLAIGLGACQTTTVGQAPPSTLALAPLFGPVISAEVIGGRADDGGEVVWLLAGGRALVHVDLRAQRVDRTPLMLPPGDQCWGLARLRDGSLWTLRGRRSVIRIEADGRLTREIALAAAHFGLFGSGDRLLYQQADFIPPAPALKAGIPGDEHPQPWSAMATRTFDTLARASVAALNMVSCGSSRAAERACWFPDEAAVTLIDAAGGSRRIALSGLEVVPPEVLLTAENPPRAVRDAFVDESGALWVVSSGNAPAGAPERPGGWLLAHYGPRGELLGVRSLSEPVRLILQVTSGRAVLLTGAGMVAEVTP
jgi:hypothetical protein